MSCDVKWGTGWKGDGSLSSTFRVFLVLNGRLVTIDHGKNPNVGDREKENVM